MAAVAPAAPEDSQPVAHFVVQFALTGVGSRVTPPCMSPLSS